MIAKGWFRCFLCVSWNSSGGLVSCGVFFEYEYKIPRYGSCQFKVNCIVKGEQANSLLNSKTWTIIMAVTGEASSVFYKVPVNAWAEYK